MLAMLACRVCIVTHPILYSHPLCIHTYRRVIKYDKVFGYYQQVIALHDIEPSEELFAKYGLGYYSLEEDPLPPPHILSNDEYVSRLSEYEAAMKKKLTDSN